MIVQECLDEYEALMEKVFGFGWLHDYIGKPLRYWFTEKFYSATTFEKVVKDLLRRKLPGKNPEDALLLDDESDSCKMYEILYLELVLPNPY